MKRAIAIYSNKGGVGKTTTAVNLTACLALSGKRVLLMDLDPRGIAASRLGSRRSGAVEPCNVIASPEKLKSAPIQADYPNICIIPPSPALTDLDQTLGSNGEVAARFREGMEEVKQSFDYLIVDCPPTLGPISRTALGAVDGTILPIQCEP